MCNAALQGEFFDLPTLPVQALTIMGGLQSVWSAIAVQASLRLRCLLGLQALQAALGGRSHDL